MERQNTYTLPELVTVLAQKMTRMDKEIEDLKIMIHEINSVLNADFLQNGTMVTNETDQEENNIALENQG